MIRNARTLVVAKKTFRDFASPKLLLTFLVPYTAITWIYARGVTGTSNEVGSLPLGSQERLLSQAFLQVSFTWAAGLPVMVLVGVLVANGIARDEQRGTLRILLSKPVSRRQVLAGKYLAVLAFGYLVTVVCLLVAAVTVYLASGASASALSGGIFGLFPGNLVYALLVVTFVSTVGTGFAVLTGSRLKTALGSILIPALFFGFLFVRILTGGGGPYAVFRLHFVDVNYHFGNAFVTFHRATGTEFSPLLQSDLGPITGVFDASNWGPDPLVGGFSGSVPLTGHVPTLASIAVVGGVSVLALAASVLRFDRKDVA